jgi:transcription antitermination protein NusB
MVTNRLSHEPRSEDRRERRRAREVALQMLYQCEVAKVDPAAAIASYGEIDQAERLETSAGEAFASRLVVGTVEHLTELDERIAASTDNWRPERMAIVDRVILRLSVYQFFHEPDVPPTVVIDEAVELARRFSGEESGRFVNGVLDAINRNR